MAFDSAIISGFEVLGKLRNSINNINKTNRIKVIVLYFKLKNK